MRAGKIVEFEVMVRPMSGLQALGDEMGRRLAPFLAAAKAEALHQTHHSFALSARFYGLLAG